MKRYTVLDGFTLESMDDCDYKSPKKIKHYLAKITSRSESGEENREYCKPSTNYDEWFNVSNVEVGDLLRANAWFIEKKFEKKKYLVVIEKTLNHIDVEEFPTYLKAKAFIDEHPDKNFKDIQEEDKEKEKNTGVVENMDLNYKELELIHKYMSSIHKGPDKALEQLVSKLEQILKDYKL